MKNPIIILHGWRVENSRYSQIKKTFEENGFKVFAPNLPGVGDEKLTKDVMKIDDYINFVLDFYKKQKIEKAILVCHSFGGRVGAKLAAKYPEKVEKLVLTGTPLIKQLLSSKKKMLIFLSGIVKKTLKLSFGETRMRKILYYLLNEWDYYKAPENIRETFKAIIAEDIAPNLSKIKTPTLIVWGEKDTFVPKSIGKQINDKIINSRYVEVENATHKLPYENPEEFAKVVLDFIK